MRYPHSDRSSRHISGVPIVPTYAYKDLLFFDDYARCRSLGLFNDKDFYYRASCGRGSGTRRRRPATRRRPIRVVRRVFRYEVYRFAYVTMVCLYARANRASRRAKGRSPRASLHEDAFPTSTRWRNYNGTQDRC